VVGTLGDGGFVANPGPTHRLEADDLVAVVGGRDQLAVFEREAGASTGPDRAADEDASQ